MNAFWGESNGKHRSSDSTSSRTNLKIKKSDYGTTTKCAFQFSTTITGAAERRPPTLHPRQSPRGPLSFYKWPTTTTTKTWSEAWKSTYHLPEKSLNRVDQSGRGCNKDRMLSIRSTTQNADAENRGALNCLQHNYQTIATAPKRARLWFRKVVNKLLIVLFFLVSRSMNASTVENSPKFQSS